VRLGGTGLTEVALQRQVIDAIHAAGLVFDHAPIVGFGANAANPHYEPGMHGEVVLEKDQVILLDLWGGRALGTVFADQTWMGFQRPHAIGEGRTGVGDGARRPATRPFARLQAAVAAGRPVAGFELDRAARGVIEAAGYGAWFVHRTGTPSTTGCTGRGRTSTTTRRTTTASCCRAWGSRWSRGST
jgi:Xaa-Pro aminopeptidase